MANLVSENTPGGNVVAIAEPAGQAQNLKLLDQARHLEQPIDMQPFGFAASALESEGGFTIAIGAGGPQYKDAWLRHERSRPSKNSF
jgi:hypothetical protein